MEAKREELAALPAAGLLSDAEVAELRAIGDNTGSMTLKGAAPDFEGEPRPDRWALTPELAALAARWGIEPGPRPAAGLMDVAARQAPARGPAAQGPELRPQRRAHHRAHRRTARWGSCSTGRSDDRGRRGRARPGWVADADDRVYVGGPVAPDGVIVLAEWADPALAVVLIEDDLGFVPGDADDTGALAAAVRRARVYAGHAGWGPGQLEAELAEESWIVEEPRRAELFSDDPEGLWAAVLRRKGREFALLSTMPPDPSLN